MRKAIVLSLVLLLGLTAGSAVAKTKYHRMMGTIDAVDAAGQSLVVKKGDASSTFKTDSSTKFKVGGKTALMSDLKAGDKVRVSYTETGTDKTAARVDVLKQAPAPK